MPILGENDCFLYIWVEQITERCLFAFLVRKCQNQHPSYKVINKLRTARLGCLLQECASVLAPVASWSACQLLLNGNEQRNPYREGAHWVLSSDFIIKACRIHKIVFASMKDKWILMKVKPYPFVVPQLLVIFLGVKLRPSLFWFLFSSPHHLLFIGS